MSLPYGVSISSQVFKLADSLKEDYKLSDFEALTLALDAEKNEMIKMAFVISSKDDHPTALEAIALALGYQK